MSQSRCMHTEKGRKGGKNLGGLRRCNIFQGWGGGSLGKKQAIVAMSLYSLVG